MRPYLKELAAKAPYYLSIHPNAGLPNSMGEYDETAEIMVPQMASFVDERACEYHWWLLWNNGRVHLPAT